MLVKLVLFIFLLQLSAGNVIPSNENAFKVCPDGRSQCPDGSTCCKLASGQYGCCPRTNAVCCSDHVHCCPENTKCDLSAGTCIKNQLTFTMMEKFEASLIVGNVVCPDGRSQCPDGSTCCKLATGQYGCCPRTNAVCCSDHVHCCPENTKCDLSAGTCIKNELTFSMMEKFEASEIVGNVVCPDGRSQCPDGSTCCKLATGQYGCCPRTNAVCCSDHVHCCPENTKCDLSAGTCIKNELTFQMMEKFEASQIVGNVVCPDKRSECPDGSTCCKLATGQYGCCPQANAVCCSDHVHCCPENTKCDLSAGTCIKNQLTFPMMEKFEASLIVGNVECPDGRSQCPDGSTCCKLASGQYGCCPRTNAVCCSDHVHCCPENTKCDLSAGTCIKNELTFPMMEKFEASEIVGNVVCPDGRSQCPDGSTCCKLASGQYGCCPRTNAVCCSDHVHCCPENTKCDLSAGTCIKNELTFQMMEKFEASQIVGNVVCPDGRSECPDGSTCCKLATGQYGCCPQANAVCCSDHVHCCPENTKCDLSAGTCIKNQLTFPMMEKFEASQIVGNVVCPDGRSQCPDGSTCCKLATGQYGCCPRTNAVCCSDHVHCCPENTKCDLSAGTCIKNELTFPMMEKFEASQIVGNVVCPDGRSQCPDGSTCCKLATGQYGCCPRTNAVCCSDHVHCCPENTKCDLSAGTCIKNELTFPMMEKFEASEIVGNVVCPDGRSQCPDGSTCCKLASGQYGCCPQANAVCCSDHVHCCPENTKCDLSAGTCIKNQLTFPMMEKFEASQIVGNVVCPDGRSQCPDGSTCCKLATGQYGCCPRTNAVCCSDHVHCCPENTKCDLSAGTCIKNELTFPMMEKFEASQIVGNVVCPDGRSQCPDGSTCCKLATGQYGCCPRTNAVCCSDHVHCCPENTKCDLSAGTCIKNELTFPMMEKFEASEIVGNVVCPDGRSQCPDGSTCCKLASGQYGCCPRTNAVCCSDHVHCCPENTKCDLSAGTCIKNELTFQMMEKFEASQIVGNVVCPDGRSQCPDGSTCCKLASGQYGCCPRTNAVCCSDHVHCCPENTKCDLSAGTCIKNERTFPLMEKFVAKSIDILPAVQGVEEKCTMCPDGSECPSYYSCCPLNGGGFGCCQFSSAVCCSDHLHCCQHNTICDLERKVCRTRSNREEPLSLMLKARKTVEKAEKITFEVATNVEFANDDLL